MMEKISLQRALVTLERICGVKPETVQPVILLTNFRHYIEELSGGQGLPVYAGAYMQVVHDFKRKFSLFNFNIGSPAAVLIISLLKFLEPGAIVFIGSCGGLHGDIQIGDWFLPETLFLFHNRQKVFTDQNAERFEANRIVNDYCKSLMEKKEEKVHTGNVVTTDFRLWQENERFLNWILNRKDLTAIEMECFFLYELAVQYSIPFTALLLIADLALDTHREKTKEELRILFEKKSKQHINYALEIAGLLPGIPPGFTGGNLF